VELGFAVLLVLLVFWSCITRISTHARSGSQCRRMNNTKTMKHTVGGSNKTETTKRNACGLLCS